MSTIDNRVVSMEFDNATFERRLSDTLNSLDKLTESLSLLGAKQGLTDVANAANNVDLSRMADSVDSISSKFSALGAIAFTVIQSITRSVIDLARNAGTDILGPIITGGKQRAINIEQAQFQFRGLGLNVEEVMANAKTAVLGTAYGLDAAAKAAAQFGASGVTAGDNMTKALRAISGAAAMTGSSFEEMAMVFTGSAGTGIVNNQDLQQFGTRGLNAAAAVGKVLGKTEAQVHDMAAAGKLDFQTFANAMDEAFGSHATAANETYTGSLANVHAAMSRLGASFFSVHLDQKRDLFNALIPVIDNITAALKPLFIAINLVGKVNVNNLIANLGKLNLTNFTQSISNFAEGFLNIMILLQQGLGVVKEAFRNIFPKSTTSILLLISQKFLEFSQHLKLGGETADKIKSIFSGFFAVIAIGLEILKEVIGTVAGIVRALLPASSGLLDFGASGGDMLTKLKQGLVDGGKIHDFFIRLSEVIQGPIVFLATLKDKIGAFFNDVSVPDNRLTSRFSQISDTISNLDDSLQGVFTVLDKVWIAVKNWFGELGSKLAEAFKPGDFNAALDILNVGLLGGIAVMLQRFLSGGFLGVLGTGLGTKIHDIISSVTATFKAMQTELKAQALMKIAEAIGVMTVSIGLLSLIDSAALTKALVAISFGFGQLIAVMGLMDQIISSPAEATKIGILGASLILFATAMGVLSASIMLLSTLSLAELGKGLVGVGVGLGLLVLATHGLSTDPAGLIKSGLAMILISAGLYALSKAVQSFSNLGWAEMAKGLVGVGAGLLILAIAMNAMPVSSALSGIGFIEVAAGLSLLALAVKEFGTMSWVEIGKGLTGIAAGLILMGLALTFIPPTAPFVGAGLLILSAALVVMAGAVKLMGSMDLATLAKGLGAIGVLLLILGVAMIAMDGALPGAAALVVVSGALVIFSKVLKTLGDLSIAQLITGLAAIAGVLALLAGAAILMLPIIPELLALGIAVGVLGAGFALLGVGIYAISRAFEIFAKSGVEGTKVLVTAIPAIAEAFAQSIIDLVARLLNAAPLLIRLITAILDQLLDTIIKLAPKIGKAFTTIITEGLKFIRETYPDWVKTGFELLMGFLRGVRDNIGEITTTVVDIITRFLDALGAKAPQIIDSVYNFIVNVLKAVVLKFIDVNTFFLPAGRDLIVGLLKGVIEKAVDLETWWLGLPAQILGWIGDLTTWLKEDGINVLAGFLLGIVEKEIDIEMWWLGLPGKILGWIGDLLGWLKNDGINIIAGFLLGVVEKAIDLELWWLSLPGKILSWIGNIAGTLAGKGIDLVVGFLRAAQEKSLDIWHWLESLPAWIVSAVGDFINTLKEAGKALMEGLLNGIRAGWDKVTGFLSSLNPLDHFNDINLRLGHAVTNLIPGGLAVMTGLHNGMIIGWSKVTNWLSKLNPSDHFDDTISNSITSSLSTLIDHLSTIDSFNPVITPVLDLTQVERDSQKLENLMRLSPISPAVSFDQANLISTTADITKSATDIPAPAGPTEIKFEQNNYSPTALSVNDIYRNTRSQIALAKEEINI